MPDTATLQIRLQEAQTALHELLTGRKTVSIQTELERVTFTQANVAELRAYIRDLEQQLGQRSRRGSAIGVNFR